MARCWISMVVVAMAFAQSAPAFAQPLEGGALALKDVIRLASERRDEVAAARARVRAGEERPVIVSALEDPMLSPALDHVPFMLGGANVSFTIEQRIPLSRVRPHRRESALADLARLNAESQRTVLDVELQAVTAFLMLQERRRMSALIDEQVTFAQNVVTAANARYASGTAPQSDVLRAEIEVARMRAMAGSLKAQTAAAEAMLNTALAQPPDAPVPPLTPLTLAQDVPSWSSIKAAVTTRPELAAGRAEVARAEAEVTVMRDMYRPMATIRTGPAYTMTEGNGWMAMVGISLPIWRAKLRAGVAEAQAMRAMSEAELQAMARMIDGEAAVAVGELQASRFRQLALRDDVLPRARMGIEPAVSAYAAGRVPLVTVVESIQALWSTEVDLVEADTALALAWARLGRAIGSYEVFQ